MSNAFDFELIADDRVSATIDEINEAIKNLLPQLDETQEKLNLGGDETVDSLDDVGGRLDKMARSARDNVQFIGDIIPPLKIVGELAGKMATFGAAGVVGFGIQKVADGFRDAAKEAYNLDTHAQNTAMSVRDFTQLAGAMRILGTDSETAAESIESVFKSLNEAASGSNTGVAGAMAQIGAEIVKNKNGSLDLLKTLESISGALQKWSPSQQKSFANAVGLTPDMLTLLREGSKYAGLLAKAERFGLTVDPELNKQLSDVNVTMNELGAAWDGLINKAEKKVLKFVMSDGSVKNGLEGVTDLLTNGDFTALSHAAGFINTNEAEKLRRIQGNKELYNKLTRRERGAVDAGFMTDAVRKRYDAEYGAMDAAERLRGDMSVIAPQKISGNDKVPYNDGHNASNTLGFRNHNPGNLRDASNTTGRNGGFSTFASDHDGLAAMARQLMLYGDRGNNTPSGILHAYAPGFENNTRAYIDDVTSRTGFGAGQRLDLHNPEALKTLMAAMISHEQGSQPYTEEQLKNAIRTAITDDRWSGKRNPELLSQQRNNINSMPTGGYPPESILTPKKSNSDSNTVTDNLARSLKDAFTEQPLRLEIVMTNDKGERKTYNVENNGKIIIPMNY
ncbi:MULTISPECIES: hypothetical protein [Klebsiella]|uniref:hypothetical protein n=1 Tax=Klebsiella TaxID=570 RepID=UPI0012B7746A|nr:MULTISPECIES: hypothetical protein [Klebsiella]MBZ7298768.1 hypothetical protein [Klebsiella michiganensis]MDM4081892.1 hypothetical protein [Klebsiella oxytoca]MDM4099246.1 hypothetical protein [Klebsiella oxytoca]MDM4173242.1 hypothetical protein [Klebsiella oxytoca]MDM4201814.1 hypothetical protein [Klebsiella oxytoca]